MKFDHVPNIFILTDHAQTMNMKNVNAYQINRMKLIDLQFTHLSSELLLQMKKSSYVLRRRLLKNSFPNIRRLNYRNIQILI